VAVYSPAMAADNQELKRFLLQNFYRNYRVMRMAVKAERTLIALFNAYVERPMQLPTELQRRVETTRDLHRVVCDYLAGMTDRYAVQEYRRLYDMEERA
jgi:dGTPase